jgi:hypothetical protein
MDTSKMAPRMKRIWDKPVERPNVLQQARDRAIGLDKLYPASFAVKLDAPASTATRATAKDKKPNG